MTRERTREEVRARIALSTFPSGPVDFEAMDNGTIRLCHERCSLDEEHADAASELFQSVPAILSLLDAAEARAAQAVDVAVREVVAFLRETAKKERERGWDGDAGALNEMACVCERPALRERLAKALRGDK